MNPLIYLKQTTLLFFAALAAACFGLFPNVQATPDAGYLGQNTAAEQNVLLSLRGVNIVSGSESPLGWSAGTILPSVGVRLVGVYFYANGKFYAMGGRSSDTAGSDFTHPFEYNPNSNTWVTKSATYPDNQVNNMACGVLTQSGTPYIYCIGGSPSGQSAATARVFRYNPVNDTIETLTSADNWPGDPTGMILPGGFAVVNNKLYILGGFNINVASTSQIWGFDPTAAVGSKWTQFLDTPEGVMYAPTCAINNIIYLAGASDFQGGAFVDTTSSFGFNPGNNTILHITAIPRATGETRALTFNGKMLVMGGGRDAPNPSSEVDVYDPNTNTWTVNSPVPAFTTARRNFATDTDGTNRIFLIGGYAPTSPTASMEKFFTPGPPFTTTNPATFVAGFSARLNGTVNPNGLTTNVHFRYGMSRSYGSMTPNQTFGGNTTQNVIANISGLNASTTYHFQIVATNADGTSHGVDRTFTTLSATGPPVAVTIPATNVTSSSATLNGTVDPHGRNTSVYFQYGQTPGYGSTTPAQSEAGDTYLNIGANISGLTASTIYHFRIVATNHYGTTDGADRTFTTP
jgi:hypothetical protein